MSEWTPFHRSLREGDKRGLPRAVRFIYLEISLLSRAYGGVMTLPRGFRSDADALHDALGGDKREVREALRLLTVPLDPEDPTDEPMITVAGPPERRVIRVTAFDRWARRDNSTPRVQKHRANKNEGYSPKGQTGNGFETPHSRGEKRTAEDRTEQDNEISVGLEKPTATPGKPSTENSTPTAQPPTAGQLALTNDAFEPARTTGDSVREVYEHYVACWKRKVGGVRSPKLDGKRRKLIELRLREKFTVEDLKSACEGIFLSDFHMGQNDREKRYIELELVCRDATHVERFMALASEHAAAESPASPHDEPAPTHGPPVAPPPDVAERLAAMLTPSPRSSLLRQVAEEDAELGREVDRARVPR